MAFSFELEAFGHLDKLGEPSGGVEQSILVEFDQFSTGGFLSIAFT